MNLNAFKNTLEQLDQLRFELPNGSFVPAHFHITEVGKGEKTFIDCGGTLRNDTKVIFQLWQSTDYDHRLHPDKTLKIIDLAIKQLHLGDWPIEVEYQGDSIMKYALTYNGKHFVLENTLTACLAEDACGIPETKQKISLADKSSTNACTPGSGCC